MSADLSGVRFDARNDFTKVVQQQGRVMLDADGNEQADLEDRRSRAHAADLGSYGISPDIAGTAVVPRTTPDAFALSIVGGALRLGRGRIYVDGVMAENHGTGPDQFDPILGDLRGADPTPYLAQPYLPNPAPLPASGRHLVYLEVRERELTWVERPDLIDPAVAVDTTARSQVIWQAKVHAPDAPGLTCETPDAAIPGWMSVIAPTAARLTVGTVPVPAATNPCSLPPSGDYRGLENQTYRVEVHDPGAAGAATFVWSRDNASVTIPVVDVASPSRLRLASLGKDSDALGLATSQWVEVLDDDHELAGLPGELRQITVHPEDRSVSFASPLPAGWPATAAAAASRHLRVRRWDGAVGATEIPSAATPIELEHGITVTLTLAAVPGSTGFSTGEYWIFHARTATTSVETLTLAPPRGPLRHVARLGIIDGTTVVSPQCTPLWPAEDDEDCGCTVCVSVSDHVSGRMTIQDGLDKVAPTGGTVCLEVGTYPVQEPLSLAGAAGVRLRGQGAGTVLTARSDGIVVERCAATTIEDLIVISSGGAGNVFAGAAAVRLIGCADTSLQQLALIVEGTGIDAGVALHDLSVTTRICRVDSTSPVGIHAIADLTAPALVDDLLIADCVLTCANGGVVVDDAVLWGHGSIVRDNRIEVQRDAGVRLGGVVEGSSSVGISGNHVVSGAQGILAVSGMTVTGNTVSARDRGEDRDVAGIRIEVSGLPGAARSSVSGNTVTGFARGGTMATGGEAVQVAANRVIHCDDGIAVVARGNGADVAVADNEITDIAERDGRGSDVAGILVAGAGTVAISRNAVGRVGQEFESDTVTGIGVLGCLTSRIVDNVVFAVGPLNESTASVDYSVIGTVAGTVEGNQSLHDLDRDGVAAFGLRINRAGRLAVSTAAGLGAVGGGRVVYAADDVLLVQALEGHEPSMIVGQNTLTGCDRGAALDATVRGAILITHNHCSAPPDVEGAVRVRADAAAVTGNRVHGGKPSMHLEVPEDRLTVLGNLTSSGISPGLAAQWAPLNVDGVA